MFAPDNERLGTTRWVLTAFLVIVGAVAIWLIRDILLLVLASVILSVLLSMPIRFCVRRGLNRPLAVLVSLVLVTVVVVLALLLLVPGLLQQFAQLAGFIPQAITELQNQISSGQLATIDLPVVGQVPFLPENLLENVDLQAVLGQLGVALERVTSAIFPVVGGVANVLVGILIVLFMSLYFVADPESYRRGVLRLAPIPYRPRAAEILSRLGQTLQGFLQAKMISMLLVGVVTAIGLTLLGIPLAPALGVLAGLFSFVPNFGPLAALIPILAVTIVNAPQQWPWTILLIYGFQLLESQIIGPWLMSEQINMPPVLVLLGQIIAGIFFGFMGLLLAVPLTAIVMVLVQEIYLKDILGDYSSIEPAARADDTLIPDGV